MVLGGLTKLLSNITYEKSSPNILLYKSRTKISWKWIFKNHILDFVLSAAPTEPERHASAGTTLWDFICKSENMHRCIGNIRAHISMYGYWCFQGGMGLFSR